MGSGAAGDGIFRSFLEGCIPGGDIGMERRPYHRNCGCALHGSSAAHCPHRSRHDKVSYPVRRSWSEGSLAMIGQSSRSPSSPAAAGIPRTPSQLALCEAAEEDGEVGAPPKA